MKHFNFIVLTVTAVLFFGCAHTPAPSAKEPAAWFEVQPGMTREKVHALLGEPQSAQQTLRNEENWKHDDWNLTVTYDNDGIVTGAVDYKTPQH